MARSAEHRPHDYSVRSADESDAEGIRAVAHTTWRAAYAGLIPDVEIERFLSTTYAASNVRDRIRRADRFDVAVHARTHAVVGFAEWLRREDEAELVATYVLPGWQHRGIGRVFHERAVEAYRHVVSRFAVTVLEENRTGRAYYEAMGYGDPQPRTWTVGGRAIGDLRYVLELSG
jgi:GNAT superfamily N-acetyltransferase